MLTSSRSFFDARILTRSAVVGGLVWMGLLFAPLAVAGPLADVATVLLLGVLVVVPLALDVAATPSRDGRNAIPYRLAVLVHPIGALGACASFFVPAGQTAAVLVAPWMLFTVFVALEGLRRLLEHIKTRTLSVHVLVTSVGFLYLPGGSGWLFLSRLGADPGPYGELIVLLTAVHFHFAAFVAPVWAGKLGSSAAADRSKTYPAFRVLGIGLVAGTPLVALGIAGSPTIETIGVMLLTASAFGLGSMGLLQAPRFPDRPGAIMLGLSAASLCLAMLWAFAFNLGPRFGWPSPDVIAMIPRHGWLNGVGFGLIGMLAWRRLRSTCEC